MRYAVYEVAIPHANTGGIDMRRAESIKREIELLPPSLLGEVERLIRELKKKGKLKGKRKTLLTELAACAM